MTKPTKWVCADSAQPGHPPNLIRVFAVRMKKPWVLSYLLSTQRRLWSDWVDAQADLSLHSVHNHFLAGERGGSVVECRTPEREVRGSRPTAAVLCPWARHFTPRKYWLITQEAMAPSRHDWKIVDWDVKPQHNNFLAHLSRRLTRWAYRMVLEPASVRACVHTFKHEYLRDQQADYNQILSEASLGWGKGCIRFWCRSDQISGFHGNG